MRFSETGLCIKGLIVNPNSGQPREESTLCAVAEERPPAAHLFAAREVDVDEQPELAKRFGIFSIPTLIAFNNGAQTEKRVGVQTAEQLAEMLG